MDDVTSRSHHQEELPDVDITASLESLRARLLDLSNRNRHLNFHLDNGHNRRRQLSFVGLQMETALKRLCREEEYRFRAVPYPDGSRGRMIPFDEFTNNPETYLDGEERRPPVDRAVLEPRARAEEHARELNIDTSYDLEPSPLQGLMIKEGEGLNYLQVLHYPDQLDLVLSSIIEANHSAERELGVSTLYLVFGFLEWVDAPGTTEVGQSGRLAPLLLLPVVLRRGSGDWSAIQSPDSPYILEWSGDEVEVNHTLRVMLRSRFGVDLPPFSQEDGLEYYLREVSRLIPVHQGWRIHHRLTLTNLTFHKLRMWEDLDPSNWPDNRLFDHPLVKDFFIGRQVDPFDRTALAIGELDESGELPPLVLDADSSQQQAIIRALNGENLVIEGPPGTGKSQTIANLIAGAMSQNKSVLFVAEKTAALEVVQRRLAEVGLSDFTLCLGTRRNDGLDEGEWLISRTRHLAHNLGRRLARKGEFGLPLTITQKREIRRSHQRRLREYHETISQYHGACGRTIYETIGRRELLYQSLRSSIDSPAGLARIEALRIDRAEGLTISQVESLEENGSNLQNALLSLTKEQPLNRHPWYGLMQETLVDDEERALFESLRSLVEVARKIESVLDEFGQISKLPLAAYEKSIMRLIEIERLLPTIEPGLRRELLQFLDDQEVCRQLRRLGKLLEQYQEEIESVTGQFCPLPELDNDDLDRLREACRQAGEAGLDGLTIDKLRQRADWMRSLAGYIERASRIAEEVGCHLDSQLEYNLVTVKVLVRVLILLNEAPRRVLHNRVTGLERESVGRLLTSARREAEELRRQADSLSKRVDRQLAPPAEYLARYAEAAASAGPFRFISSDYRQARREWLGMVTQDDIRTTRQMVRDFRDLLNYQNGLKEFTTRPEYLQLGSIFRGLETPFTAYDQIVKWYERIKLIVGQASEPARQISKALFTVPNDNLKQLLHLIEVEAPEEIADFNRFFGGIESYLTLLPSTLRPEGGEHLLKFVGRLREAADVCQSICTTFDDLQVESPRPLGELVESLAGLTRLNGLREEIRLCGEEGGLGEIFGVEQIEPDLDFSGVLKTISFFEQLDSTSLPREYLEWLSSEEIEHRVATIRGAAIGLQTLFSSYNLSRQRFCAVSGVDERRWYGGAPTQTDYSLRDVRRRAELALEASEDLPRWLVAQRALRALERQGLLGLTELVEDGTVPLERLTETLDFVYHNSILHSAFRQYPHLAEYSGLMLDEIRRRFALIDREVIELSREEIAARIDSRPVPPGNRLGPVRSYTELGLLQHLASNHNARFGIRQVMRRSASALLALKPCFMMSPLAVSRYLPPGSIRFDLVIMDEASQLRPEDALGAIARGAQVVVVGDRLQLPPTSFFDTTLSNASPDSLHESGEQSEVDQAATLEDFENILEIAASRYQPVCQLKWHYRSRHQSLIEFSNREFYEHGGQGASGLTVFPSPWLTSEQIGCHLRYVEKGVWEQSCNHLEAMEVVKTAIDHLVNHQTQSLGIVTLNLRQKELILDLLERSLRESPPATRQFQYWQQRGEEMFVKNIETVQGDERDVIMVSGTVGPDINGYFRLTSLGPLNNKRYGHRRLNVLITRARQRLLYFSSIRPADIQLGPNSSWGVRALKSYLTFLEAGSAGATGVHSMAVADFVESIAQYLKGRGLDVVTSPDSSGGSINLAVVDPLDPNHLLLGIECDSGHADLSGTVRDRDRIRPTVLAGMGWSMHRVWASDWFRSRDQELERIFQLVNEMISGNVTV